MITFRKADWEDKDYDSCGNTAIAVLEIDSITIPLCDKCVNDLTDQIKEYHDTIFCHKCSEFVMSRSGWRYGGSCKKKAALHGETITIDNAGFDYSVDCLNTCKDAKPLEV